MNVSGNEYRLESDPNWKVTKHTTTNPLHPVNAADASYKDYWIVRTTDGTKYRFGAESEDYTGADLNSVQYVTVRDDSVCPEPTDLCEVAYQWNLDRVVDMHGNVVSYFYEHEMNRYRAEGGNGLTYYREYVRASHLDRIEYTKRNTSSRTANAQIKFNWEIRCGDASSTFGNCTFPGEFWDTPDDLWCKYNDTWQSNAACDERAPTFWSQLRLGSIQTMVRRSSTSGRWNTLTTHDLAQTFPHPPSGNSERKLVLYRIHPRIGGQYEHFGFEQLNAIDHDAMDGVRVTSQSSNEPGDMKFITDFSHGDHIMFEDVYFGAGSSGDADKVVLRYSATGAGKFELRSSLNGGLFGTVAFDATGGVRDWETAVVTLDTSQSGISDLYVVAKDDAGSTVAASLYWVRFRGASTADYNNIPGLPAVDFAAGTGSEYFTWLANRVNHEGTDPQGLAGVSRMEMPRIERIRNELGGYVEFTYNGPQTCTQGSTSTPDWTDQHDYCYPALYNGAWIAWRKYVVTRMEVGDTFSGNPTETYDYEYWSWKDSSGTLVSGPSWAHLDDPVLDATKESWNVYRGHGKVRVTDALGEKTEHFFFQGMHGDKLNSSGGSKTRNAKGPHGDLYPDDNWLTGRGV